MNADVQPGPLHVAGTAISREEAEILVKVLQALREIKFGSVQITIQDARVVQIDRTEKHRFTAK